MLGQCRPHRKRRGTGDGICHFSSSALLPRARLCYGKGMPRARLYSLEELEDIPGTHVFTAVVDKADSNLLHWSVVSVPMSARAAMRDSDLRAFINAERAQPLRFLAIEQRPVAKGAQMADMLGCFVLNGTNPFIKQTNE